MENEMKFARLRRFNAIMGLLHLVQGILMILLSNDKTYPIYSNFLSFDTQSGALLPKSELFIELRFGPAVAMFLLLSAVAHGILSTVGYGWYVENLKKGMNPLRFYEYALSSSLMIVLIGMLVGLWDLGALILIFALNSDGTAQSDHGKDGLDLLHLRRFRRHHPLDRHRLVLHRFSQHIGREAA
jgi:hypothetical protein